MFDFHEKRKIRGILYSKTAILCLAAFALFLAFSAYNRYKIAEEMKTKLESRQAEYQELEMRAQALQTQVEYLENERGIEEELRNRFDVAKEGEQVIILLEDTNKETKESIESLTQSNDEFEETKSFFEKLKFW